MNIQSIENIVFSGDILRIENNDINRFKNPQAINVDWIRNLFEPLISSIFTNANVISLYGDENREDSIRWIVYDSLDLPWDETSWSSIYRDEKIVSKIIEDYISENFLNSLWVTFEAPPYLISALSRAGITYIDFTIHPVRFLPDYFFGIRSNNLEINNKLRRIKLDDGVIRDFARISKSKTVRTFRKEVPKDSVLFIGQLASDASLVVDNRMPSIENIRDELRQLTLVHDIVYYKAHPHLKNIDVMKGVVKDIPNCEWLDINIYDALGSDQFNYFATMSSGTYVESGYFDKQCKRILNNPNLFDESVENSYVPVYACYLMNDFWNYIFLDGLLDHKSYFPDPINQALKTTLNMKWGR